MDHQTEFIAMLRNCMIFTLDGNAIDASIFENRNDVPLSTLSIDSLAAMQLCIDLENRFGWSITPEEFLAFESLGEVARALDAHVSS